MHLHYPYLFFSYFKTISISFVKLSIFCSITSSTCNYITEHASVISKDNLQVHLLYVLYQTRVFEMLFFALYLRLPFLRRKFKKQHGVNLVNRSLCPYVRMMNRILRLTFLDILNKLQICCSCSNCKKTEHYLLQFYYYS